MPYANQREPADTGVAVYFQLQDAPMVFACDKYNHVRDNIRAIGKTIEALRGIERWGASDMMERAFTGFQALPPPGDTWHGVLQIQPGDMHDDIQRRYRKLRSEAHRNNDGDWLQKIQNAWKEYEAQR